MHASEKRGVAQDRMRQAFLSMDRRENASMSSCSVRDSFTQPPWQSSDLGIPIPDSAHAVSVAMPTWDSVVGYEEDDAKVMRALQCGYPRFFCHPKVQALFDEATRRFARAGEASLVFGSKAACERCRDFLCVESRIEAWPESEACALVFPKSSRSKALRYWRYTGEIVSSRQAEAMLTGQEASADGKAAQQLLKRLASWSDQSSSNGHLYASGMAAIFAAFRAAIDGGAPGKTIQLEFPYVDVFCIQKHLGEGAHLLLGNDLVSGLERYLRDESIRAVFCEIPCNPLTRTIDLPEFSRLCRAAGVPLIVDDTLGTIHNVDVYPYADLVTTSLTKNISGMGDVMAGSVWVSETSPFAEQFQRFLSEDESAPLHPLDVDVLLTNSKDFPQRMQVINANAKQLASFLAERAEVERIYYPDRETVANYKRLRRSTGGNGGLISLVLRGGEEAARKFYDALRVSKGPSLGTNFTLACPYTLLAHYEELAWAESCGVSRNLIRLAVGMEPLEDLQSRFESAFAAI